jgi:streptogramin lyase
MSLLPRRALRSRRWLNVLMPVVAIGLSGTAQAQAEKDPKSPDYPRVTLSTSYKVDPDWPQKPRHVQWGEMPGVAVDRHDNVWLFTRAKPPVQAYTAEGKYLTGWGDELVRSAHHMKFDHEGNIWLADIGQHVVMQFTPSGKLLKMLGTRGRAGNDQTHLNQPTDMAIAPSGDVFVSDGYGNNRIVHFDSGGKFVKAWGKLGTLPGEFSLPHAIARDSKGRLYVADRNNARVQVFERSGKFVEEWRDVVVPWGFCVTKQDEIWVCGSSPMAWGAKDESFGCPPKDQVFMRFNTAGRLLQLWTVPKGEDGNEKSGECNWVHAIAQDSQGNLYAGDIVGKRVQKFIKQK